MNTERNYSCFSGTLVMYIDFFCFYLVVCCGGLPLV